MACNSVDEEITHTQRHPRKNRQQQHGTTIPEEGRASGIQMSELNKIKATHEHEHERSQIHWIYCCCWRRKLEQSASKNGSFEKKKCGTWNDLNWNRKTITNNPRDGSENRKWTEAFRRFVAHRICDLCVLDAQEMLAKKKRAHWYSVANKRAKAVYVSVQSNWKFHYNCDKPNIMRNSRQCKLRTLPRFFCAPIQKCTHVSSRTLYNICFGSTVQSTSKTWFFSHRLQHLTFRYFFHQFSHSHPCFGLSFTF